MDKFLFSGTSTYFPIPSMIFPRILSINSTRNFKKKEEKNNNLSLVPINSSLSRGRND